MKIAVAGSSGPHGPHDHRGGAAERRPAIDRGPRPARQPRTGPRWRRLPRASLRRAHRRRYRRDRAGRCPDRFHPARRDARAPGRLRCGGRAGRDRHHRVRRRRTRTRRGGRAAGRHRAGTEHEPGRAGAAAAGGAGRAPAGHRLRPGDRRSASPRQDRRAVGHGAAARRGRGTRARTGAGRLRGLRAPRHGRGAAAREHRLCRDSRRRHHRRPHRAVCRQRANGSRSPTARRAGRPMPRAR